MHSLEKMYIGGMERLLYKDLLAWKASKDRKPLILNGARQVGKTWLLKEFGRREYESVAYINCEKAVHLEAVFEDFETVRLVRALSALSGVDIRPGKTLLILDEIQEFPRALTGLKYFCEDAPEYHVVVAGSLLGIALHAGISFPVGKVDFLRLYPLTFEEFLLANNRALAVDALNAKEWDTLKSLSSMFVEFLRQYYYVGGMPAVVSAFLDGSGPAGIRKMQKQILADYESDFSKHAPPHEYARIKMIWDSIPRQLAKENKKFMYSELKKGERASKYELALQWLLDAGLVYKVQRVSKVQMPVRFYEEPSVYKLFTLDVGLLGAQMDVGADQVLIGEKIFAEYNGAFAEEYVLTQLMAMEKVVRYYSTNDSQVELDFVVQTDSRVVPVEVKAEENVRSKSLRTFIERNRELVGLRFSMKPYINQQWMENVPLFAVQGYFK